jgi:hypothetical protein
VGPRPLFNLDLDVGGGVKKRIVVLEGSDPAALAAAFVTANGLPPSVVPRLVGIIESSIAARRQAKAGQAPAPAAAPAPA